MDAAYIAQLKERSVFEAARTEPPGGFPKFPGCLLGDWIETI